MPEIDSKTLYRPSVIAQNGWITNTLGRPTYQYVLSIIRAKQLKAQNLGQGKVPYYLVPGAEILRYKKEVEGVAV